VLGRLIAGAGMKFLNLIKCANLVGTGQAFLS